MTQPTGVLRPLTAGLKVTQILEPRGLEAQTTGVCISFC
jgi:hypothetical protein